MTGLVVSIGICAYKVLLFAYIVGHALHRVRVNERFAPVLYMAFGTATSLVTVLYWLAHLLMAKGSIYSFSAIDVGEMGVQMLYASALSSSLGLAGRRNLRALVISGILAAFNAGLWLAWTGALVKDVLGGLSLWFFLYAAIYAAYRVGKPTMRELRFLEVNALLITALQVAAVLDVGGWGSTLDTISCFCWIVGGAPLLVQLWRRLRARCLDDETLCYACLSHVWFLCAVYLSFEPFYFVVEVCSSSMTLIIYLCLLRKANDS